MNFIPYFPSSYVLKKITIVLIFLAVFFGYLRYRFNAKRKELRPAHYYYYGPQRYGGPSSLIERCSSIGPIFISFKTTNNYEKNAQLLVSSGYNSESLCTSKFINICDKDKKRNCDTVDLRIFLREYFVEIISQPIFSINYYGLINRTCKENEKDPHYFLKRDLEWMPRPDFVDYAHRNQFEILGFMLGLAAATGTFLDIKFAPFFHCNEYIISDLLWHLELVDAEQYALFQEIKDNYFADDSFYEFVPDHKPFKRSREKHKRAYVIYKARDFPMKRAAEEIFIKPYLNSRKFINQGIRIILGEVYDNSYYSITNYIDRNNVFSNYDYLHRSFNSYQWKDFSDYEFTIFTKSAKIFWVVLLTKYLDEEQFKIFQKISGLTHFPIGGFQRLPRTKIFFGQNYDGDSQIFDRKFEVRLKPDSTVESLKEEIDLYMRFNDERKND